MSLIYCRTDRYVYCPFIYGKEKRIFLCPEREVIMIITVLSIDTSTFSNTQSVELILCALKILKGVKENA